MDIKTVYDDEFKEYGAVLVGYEFEELIEKVKKIEIPETGISYVRSVECLEKCKIRDELRDRGFGGMPIQIGYCTGHNKKLNCMEYHKSSEFNIAADDVVLMLGRIQDIKNGYYDTSQVKAFKIPAGTGVELYGTTLHYAPCDYGQNGFRVVCVLPEGTNAEKSNKSKPVIKEDEMLWGKNKWLLVHPEFGESEEGGYVGLKGENVCLIWG